MAKLITTAPARFSNDEKNAYLTGVTEQVKDLLLYGLFKNDKVYVCTGCSFSDLKYCANYIRNAFFVHVHRL